MQVVVATTVTFALVGIACQAQHRRRRSFRRPLQRPDDRLPGDMELYLRPRPSTPEQLIDLVIDSPAVN